MGLAAFFFLFLFFFLRGLNLCFPWDVVFQILFLFCTCCFRLVKCSWIMLVYFHNFVLWEESCRETFSQNGADMFGRWGQTDGVKRIFVLWGRIIRAVFSQISTVSQVPLGKGVICMFLSSNFSNVTLVVQRKDISSFFLFWYFNTEWSFCTAKINNKAPENGHSWYISQCPGQLWANQIHDNLVTSIAC